jgi:hypothetical protein
VFDYGRSKQGTGSYSFKKNWGFEPHAAALRVLPVQARRRAAEQPEQRQVQAADRDLAAHAARRWPTGWGRSSCAAWGEAMANLLYLVHRLPYPPNKGDKVRSYHLLQHLAARHRSTWAPSSTTPRTNHTCHAAPAVCRGARAVRCTRAALAWPAWQGWPPARR